MPTVALATNLETHTVSWQQKTLNIMQLQICSVSKPPSSVGLWRVKFQKGEELYLSLDILQWESLVRWKNATGMRDFTFIAEHVTKTLHGKNTGPWSLSFKVFRDNNQKRQQVALKDSKLLYQVSLAQQPGHVYCMIDGSVVVEAEKEMEIILSRLKNLWQLRQSVTIEGTSYEIGDFTLRVANILLGSTYKGLLLEIDYHPCSTPNNASELFKEFVESIVPPTAQLSCEYEYNYEAVGLSNGEFTTAHTGYQYMMLFKNDGLF